VVDDEGHEQPVGGDDADEGGGEGAPAERREVDVDAEP